MSRSIMKDTSMMMRMNLEVEIFFRRIFTAEEINEVEEEAERGTWQKWSFD